MRTLRQYIQRALVLAAAVSVMLASPAFANEWNERTIIKLSDPVMVPGATLQPGSYVFRLLDSDSNRHIVQIFKQGDERNVVTTAQAIPARRQDAKSDTVVKFNPTSGEAPALKAWFYPGSLYGHEFVYSDEEARTIADRTKTLVLSGDVRGDGDMEKGTLYTYDAQGQRRAYTRDATMEKEWAAWHRDQVNRQRQAEQGNERQMEQGDETEAPARAAGTRSAGHGKARVAAPSPASESTAPMMLDETQAARVDLDQIEDNPSQFTGRQVAVDAEVERVFGPRLFTIDEPTWWDLDSEVLVLMRTDLAALVREDDRITVTGTLKPFVAAEFEREWGWLDPDGELVMELSSRPVLVASRIVGGTNDVAMSIRTVPSGAADREDSAVASSGTRAPEGPVGTAGAGTKAPLTNLQTLATADDEVVGRNVRLENVQLTPGKEKGLWASPANGPRVYVLPSASGASAQAGTATSIEGAVLEMPQGMRERLDPGGDWNEEIYIYATKLTR
jgi:hypothetical protein